MMKILSNGSERLMLLSCEGILSWRRSLGEARLLRGHVAPLLDNRLLDGSGVGPGPGADLLGEIDTLLGGGELGNQLGHVLAGPLGLEGTLFLGGVLDDGLHLVITLLFSLSKSTAGGGAELPGLLGAAGDGGVLLDLLLGDAAHLLGPLGALGVGGVAGGLVLALLLDLGPALDNIILDVMHLLLGPALGLVLSAADLRSLNVTVLDQRSSADLDCLVESNLLVLDETTLSEVLLALLLLLGVVVGDVGGVASLVVAVVTLDNIIILDLLDHLDLVNTSLAVGSGGGSGNIIEAGGGVRSSLTLSSGAERLGGGPGGVILMMVMMVMSVVISVSTSVGVEGEGVDQRLAVSGIQTPELSGAEDALSANSDDEKQLCIHVVSCLSLQVSCEHE